MRSRKYARLSPVSFEGAASASISSCEHVGGRVPAAHSAKLRASDIKSLAYLITIPSFHRAFANVWCLNRDIFNLVDLKSPLSSPLSRCLRHTASSAHESGTLHLRPSTIDESHPIPHEYLYLPKSIWHTSSLLTYTRLHIT